MSRATARFWLLNEQAGTYHPSGVLRDWMLRCLRLRMYAPREKVGWVRSIVYWILLVKREKLAHIVCNHEYLIHERPLQALHTKANFSVPL